MTPARKRDLFTVPSRIVQTAHGPVTIEAQQPVLRCACLGASWSATPGDYWQLGADEVLRCGECDEDMELGYLRSVWKPVAPAGVTP